MNIFRNVLLGEILVVSLFIVFIIFSNEIVSKNISNALEISKVAAATYDVSYINKIDESNFIETSEQIISTDNKYENEILKKGDNDIYKLIELKIDKTDCFLLVVYDPSKVRLMASKAYKTKNNTGKERVLPMVERYGALAGVNGGGFFDDGKEAKDIPIGYVIKDGEIIWNYNYKRKGLCK